MMLLQCDVDLAACEYISALSQFSSVQQSLYDHSKPGFCHFANTHLCCSFLNEPHLVRMRTCVLMQPVEELVTYVRRTSITITYTADSAGWLREGERETDDVSICHPLGRGEKLTYGLTCWSAKSSASLARVAILYLPVLP